MILGIDVGGTFTDLVAFHGKGEEMTTFKVLSTPPNPDRAALDVLDELLEARPETVRRIVHSTTVGTNTLLASDREEWPRVALLTTEGFRDVLEIGRQDRPSLYDLSVERPRPLVPRRLRIEVEERTSAEGRVLKEPQRSEVEEIGRRLREEEVDGVAVAFLHSYANSENERMVRRLLAEEMPDTAISISSDVDPEPREYERTSTTVVNSILTPVLSNYISRMIGGLRRRDLSCPLLVMTSGGSMVETSLAVDLPASLLESGPSSGVVATAHLASETDLGRALSFDMGGTTAKAGTVIDGSPQLTYEFEAGALGASGSSIRGAGYPVRIPTVDLVEINSGGGTVAWIDDGGRLRIGPQSAGARPGPACYGFGGSEATLTDAQVVLGRLNPNHLLGGEMEIDSSLSQEVIRREVAEPLDLSLLEAAEAIVSLADHHMSQLLRKVTIQRGHDPRDFSLVAFGGAGPLHACSLADEIGLDQVVVPPSPGLFSASGLTVADMGLEKTEALIQPLSQTKETELTRKLEGLEQKVGNALVGESTRDELQFERRASLRYLNQGYELTVHVPRRDDVGLIERLESSFHERHRQRYGYSSEGSPVEVVAIRVRGRLEMEKARFQRTRGEGEMGESNRGVFVDGERGREEVPVLSRNALTPEDERRGPLVVEEYDSTTFVPHGWLVRLDRIGNIRARIEDSG